MARARDCPARKAVAKIVGMGNLPLEASRVAAIRPNVAAGNNASDKNWPSSGITDSSDTSNMNMKNKPAKAKGKKGEPKAGRKTQNK